MTATNQFLFIFVKNIRPSFNVFSDYVPGYTHYQALAIRYVCCTEKHIEKVLIYGNFDESLTNDRQSDYLLIIK